jgi:hypothetical protein
MDSEISVYGEAKGEYTRQLNIFLTPCLETYFLELLEQARQQSPTPQKVLWNFQSLLQSIPDWNQDKVTRETEKIQKDCRCDYLEELLTAVFIAHTKVLSAIRLTTKQKKLQITIPKLEHFLHRVLSECARSLYTNAFLYAETNSIEKQKNLRQASQLIQDSILQAIRGLLPVKSILREYLHEDEDEEDEKEEVEVKTEVKADKVEEVKTETEEVSKEETEVKVEEAESQAADEPEGKVEEEKTETLVEEEKPQEDVSSQAIAAATPEQPVPPAQQQEQVQQSVQSEQTNPMIFIDTKPSVSFTQDHVFFDSDQLNENGIQEAPFAEAELREDEPDSEEELEEIGITDEILPMEVDEIIT